MNLKKLIWLFLSLGFSFKQTALSLTCPSIESIFASRPDSDGTVRYLATGWHSESMPMYELSRLSFYQMYTNASGIICVYDTKQGYIEIRPNNHWKVDTSALRGLSQWNCTQRESFGLPPSTQWVCTCQESITICEL